MQCDCLGWFVEVMVKDVITKHVRFPRWNDRLGNVMQATELPGKKYTIFSLLNWRSSPSSVVRDLLPYHAARWGWCAHSTPLFTREWVLPCSQPSIASTRQSLRRRERGIKKEKFLGFLLVIAYSFFFYTNSQLVKIRVKDDAKWKTNRQLFPSPVNAIQDEGNEGEPCCV